MKKALVVILFVLMLSTAFAYDLNACQDDNAFGGIGNCIIRGSFGGSNMFFALIILLLFTVFMWSAHVPAGAAIGVGLITFFALGDFMGVLSQTLMNLAVLAIGVMIGLAILHFVRR